MCYLGWQDLLMQLAKLLALGVAEWRGAEALYLLFQLIAFFREFSHQARRDDLFLRIGSTPI